MKIYLIDKNTKRTIEVFDNVESWNENFVVFTDNGYLGKTYCNENECFTDIDPAEESGNRDSNDIQPTETE